MLGGYFSICCLIIYTNRQKDLMCLRCEYKVQTGSCITLDVIFPNACKESISALLGMSGKTLLSIALPDAITSGLHCMKMRLMFVQPEAEICVTKNSATRWTHIYPLFSLDIATSNYVCSFSKFCSMDRPSTASKITPHILCGAYSATEVVLCY